MDKTKSSAPPKFREKFKDGLVHMCFHEIKKKKVLNRLVKISWAWLSVLGLPCPFEEKVNKTLVVYAYCDKNS